MRGRLTAIVVSMAAAGALAAAIPTTALAKNWKPDCNAAIYYAQHRAGSPAFALRTANQWCPYRPNHIEPSASVIKAMILVAYLNLPDVRNRGLSDGERGELGVMIEQSNDSAANDIFYNHVGFDGLNNLAAQVGMQHFATHPDPSPGCCEYWGRSSIAAGDQSKFFLHIDRYTAKKHRSFALQLLSSIDPSYGYWGIADVSVPGWTKYWKSGWGAGTGWVDSQSILLRRGKMRVALSILTHNDPDHTYGKNTLRGIAGRLLRGLNRNANVR